MKSLYALKLAALLAAGGTLWSSENALFSENFENGLGHFGKSGKWRLTSEAAYSGEKALEILAPVGIFSEVPVKPGRRYRLRMVVRTATPKRAALRVEEITRDGGVSEQPPVWLSGNLIGYGISAKKLQWLPFEVYFDTSKNAKALKMECRFSSGSDRLLVDDISIEETGERPMVAPDPVLEEKIDRYALMLPGPDGYNYPNFTAAGLQKPWKSPDKIFKVNDFGAIPDDGKNDADAIRKAIDAAGKAGGGVVEFGVGEYTLTEKIGVSADRVVLRGVDRVKSRIVCTLPENGLGIFSLRGGDFLRENKQVKGFFPRQGAKAVRIGVDNKTLTTFSPAKFEKLPDRPDDAAVVFQFDRKTVKPYLGGSHRVFLEVDYDGAPTRRSEAVYRFDDAQGRFNIFNSSYITFGPVGSVSAKSTLAAPAKRGDRELRFTEPLVLKPGDFIIASCVVTPEFRRRLVNNRCPWWKSMNAFYEIESCEDNGRLVKLTSKLRRDYPAASKITVPVLLRGCGLENLTLHQATSMQIELKMATVVFNGVANSRAANFTVERPGTRGIYFEDAVHCEISDVEIGQPWRIKQQGLAYTGFERAQNCLMRNVVTRAMRHAPILNWDCSGCVVTSSTFHDSDAQWHGGWSHDNLFEKCTVTMKKGGPGGSYGWAFFAVPVEDAGHGVIGPRNVIYNCDAVGVRGGVYLGGMNQQWMIMYNRIAASEGPGILVRFGCRDALIVGNTFSLADPNSPMIRYESRENSGDRVFGNLLLGGNGKIAGGAGTFGSADGNTTLKYGARINGPVAPTPSLYDWQRATCLKPAK